MRPGAREGIRQGTRRRAGGRGFALVLVLTLVVIMSVIVAAFTRNTWGGYNLSNSRATQWSLYYAARAAVEESKAQLWQTLATNPSLPGLLTPGDPVETEINGAKVRVVFDDEAGKFPINDFALSDEARRKELVLALARLFDKLSLPGSTSLATAVRDYIDSDSDDVRVASAKNDTVFDLSELLKIDGLDTDTLYTPRRKELPSAASVMTPWYRGKININTAGPEVLRCFAPRLTDADIKAIIASRAEQPFVSTDEMAGRGIVTGEGLVELTSAGGVTTDTVSLKVEARRGPYYRRITAVVWIESSEAHTLYLRDGWQE